MSVADILLSLIKTKQSDSETFTSCYREAAVCVLFCCAGREVEEVKPLTLFKLPVSRKSPVGRLCDKIT